MRVTFSAAHREASAGLQDAAARMLEYQRQVSTNKRVEVASDDPSAMAAVTVERAREAALDQYSQAADSAKSRLMVADTVLSDVIQQLGSAQVTALAASGAQNTQVQRDAWALELEGLRDALFRNMNASFRGTYLFGGAAGVQPYTKDALGVISAYQGSTVEVAVDVDREHEVAVTFDGQTLAKGADADDIFAVMDDAIAAARAGDDAALATAMAGIDRAFTRATVLQNRVGASLRTIEEDKIRLAEGARAAAVRISSLEDANMVEAITGMNEAQTVYSSALGAAAQIHRLSLMDYLK